MNAQETKNRLRVLETEMKAVRVYLVADDLDLAQVAMDRLRELQAEAVHLGSSMAEPLLAVAGDKH